MLLFGLESLRSPHQCLIGLYFRCSSVQRILPRDPTEREFLLNLHAFFPWGASLKLELGPPSKSFFSNLRARLPVLVTSLKTPRSAERDLFLKSSRALAPCDASG